MVTKKLLSALSRLQNAYDALIGGASCYSKELFAYHKLSFSQEGEDAILHRIFEKKPIGFYVDVGSHHPQRFSNTYQFYLRGWNGINIDPIPGSKACFDSIRKRDVNLETGISDNPGELIYYIFEESALNTFNQEVASSANSTLISKNIVYVQRLSDVLSQYLMKNQQIDFLTIDVEGLDLQVLRSNDWTRYRPSYVLTEALDMRDIAHVLESELHQYMHAIGYTLYAKAVNTLFYADIHRHS